MANILLVDDDELVRDIIEMILANEGHTVSTARDGIVALTEFRRDNKDLVITDIVMPDSEGIELVRAIRAEAPTCPILAISGAVQGDLYLRGALRLGANAALAKPFGARELLEKVNELLAPNS